jgi:hypothetical protein
MVDSSLLKLGGASAPSLEPRAAPLDAETVPHATRRWAEAVVGVLRSAVDPKTVDAWGRLIGASGSAIRQWCRPVGISPKASLDFARVLRAVVVSQGRRWDLYDLLDVVDERTMRSLLRRGGVPGLIGAPRPPETARYLAEQRFVTKELAVQAVAALLPGAAERREADWQSP